MKNNYEFKGSKFPWKISPSILQIYSSDNEGFDTGHEVCNMTIGEWGDTFPVIKPVGSTFLGNYKVDMEMIPYGNTPREISELNANMIGAVGDLFQACVNFIDKVDSGESRYVRDSYIEMKSAVEKVLGK